MKLVSCVVLAGTFLSADAAHLRGLIPEDTPAPTAAPTAAPVGGMGSIDDIAIANFGLQLECLEAEFYSWAAYGEGLSDELRGGGPPTVGPTQAQLKDPNVIALANELAKNEIAHVAFLRETLGEAALPCPQMDLLDAFAAAANAAVGAVNDALVPLDPPYTPYYNDAWFLLGAFIFEDVGVTAYNGAAPLIEDKGILGAAASIMSVEAYHAGAIRELLIQLADTELTPYTLTVEQATTAISDLRAAVGGGKDSPIIVDGEAVVVPADDNALAYARSIDEVLAIVYLGGKGKGGFFPQGINM